MTGLDRRRFLFRSAQAAGLALVGNRLLDLAAAGETLDLTGAVPIAGIPFPGIVTRAEWGADESLRRGPTEFAPLQKIVVHHTATQNNDTDPAQRMRAIYLDHLGNGWNDIAYHFVISQDGRIWEGRWARDYPPGEAHIGESPDGQVVTGAHALNHNTGTLGVALLGTFTGEAPSAAALESAVKLLSFYCDRHSFDPFDVGPYTNAEGATVALPTICGHRDVRATACPGDRLYGLIQQIRERVAQTIANGFIGYRIVSSAGDVAHFGGARNYGDMNGVGVRTRIVGGAGVPNAQGYWLADPSGAVYSFGAAGFFGSLPGLRAAGHRIGDAPIIGMAATPSGNGYWLYDAVGGIFALGDAGFFGSVPGLRAAGIAVGPARIVAMVSTPSGRGYWVVDEFGGIFAFGDAGWFGSLPALRNAGVRIGPARIVSMAATASGRGYWLLDELGGIFAFGDAVYHGSLPGLGINDPPARRIVSSLTGNGYVIVTRSGAVYAFGDAPFHGRWITPGLDVVDLVPVLRTR